MSIPIYKRREGCLVLLRNDMNVEKAVEHILDSCSDETSMLRAKYPEKLARNIVTMGGSGVQQELNILAMQQAVAQYGVEQGRQEANRAKAEADTLKAQLELANEALASERNTVNVERKKADAERKKADDSEMFARKQLDRIQEKEEEVNRLSAENTQLRIEAAGRDASDRDASEPAA